MKTITDKQKDFELKVAKILGFSNSYIMQRESSENMIIDDLCNSHLDILSGTKCYKKNNGDILLIATKDSEVNYINEITLKMIKIIIEDYCSPGIRKVIFATNIPIAMHSSKAKDLKKDHNFHIKGIGYSFCQKHNLEHINMY